MESKKITLPGVPFHQDSGTVNDRRGYLFLYLISPRRFARPPMNIVGIIDLVIAFGHTLWNTPQPFPTCEAKPQWARLVLGWGTTREPRGAECILYLFVTFSSDVILNKKNWKIKKRKQF
jgi:hypothetical protein